MSKTVKSGGFGKIKRTTYNGKPCIVKKMKISLNPNLSLTLTKIGQTTRKKYINPIIESIIMTEKEARNMIECRKYLGDNIAEIYGYNLEKCEIYMKEYDGDLSQLKKAKLPVSQKYFITLDILNGLEAIHRLNLVHSDLKPKNVLYEYNTKSGTYEAFITDFGLCGEKGGEIEGCTEDYSPLDDELTEKFDIYCLGKTLAEFFCDLNEWDIGKLNFDNFTSVCLKKFFQNEEMYNLVRNSLKKHPKDRPNLGDFYIAIFSSDILFDN